MIEVRGQRIWKSVRAVSENLARRIGIIEMAPFSLFAAYTGCGSFGCPSRIGPILEDWPSRNSSAASISIFTAGDARFGLTIIIVRFHFWQLGTELL